MTSQCWKGCYGTSALSRRVGDAPFRSWRDPWRWASTRVSTADLTSSRPPGVVRGWNEKT
jgi:hypothetical protein